MTDDPDWVAAGLDELTGEPDGPPVVPRGRLGAGLRRLGASVGPDVDGPALAAERARHTGFRRRGRISCGGGARLLPARDRVVVVNLPRRDDVELVEAWLGVPPGDDPWADVARGLARIDAVDAVERGQLLGLPVAVAVTPEEADDDEQARARRGFERVVVAGERRSGDDARPGAVRVVDLSVLWAGPLCGRLLAGAGHHVVKVETASRADGARYGPPAFFDALNGMKEQRVVEAGDLAEAAAEADIVIVSGRPRALRQLGLDPFDAVERRPWQVWVAITGYGMTGPWADRVAFGDDAAVAAGLSSLAGGVFCADALADPCAGLAAAAGALQLLRAGRGGVVDVSLREAAACVRS